MFDQAEVTRTETFFFKMSQIKIELCDNELCPKKETKQKYHYNSVNKVIKYLLTGMRYKDTEYASR